MKAWEVARDIVLEAEAKVIIEKEEAWTLDEMQKYDIEKIRTIWHSIAPGSGAPSSLLTGAVQSVENMGRKVEKAEELLELGYKMYSENNNGELMKITSQLAYEMNNAPKDETSDYWNYKIYNSWEEFKANCNFPQSKNVDLDSQDYRKAIYEGWMGQIAAGSFGTALEGYHRIAIKKKFSEVKEYLKKPSTYNDDITYELAFMQAILKNEKNITSKDIAEEWIARVPFGWSAEDIALKNLMLGIYPPESGYLNNPYREWIGAQMRGAICGMIAPGDIEETSRLAWIDGEISHHNSGIIGEVFNAVMTSLAFIEKDIRKIVVDTIEMLPKDSEYYSVVKYALDTCMKHENWEDALIDCEKKYEKFNLVHAFPNAAIEVVALWYGNGDFDETMNITAIAGLDVDCNAAQIGNVVAIANRGVGLAEKWIAPIGNELLTYVRGMEKLSINELVDHTITCAKMIMV